MSIDRDSYEPITGNPRRSTKDTDPPPPTESENPDQENGGAPDSNDEDPEGGAPKETDGAPMAPDGAPEREDRAPRQENGAPETGGGAPGEPDGAPGEPDGAPSEPDGAPENHRFQDASASEDSTEGEGGESRQDKVSPAQHEPESESKEGTPAEIDDGHPRQPRGRKRRVKVTPHDWEKLEEVSEHLEVGYSTVYRMAFRQLISQNERPYGCRDDSLD